MKNHKTISLATLCLCIACNNQTAAPKVDETTRLANLLESCDARSPLRDYGNVKVNHDTIGVLLEVASADIDQLLVAAKHFFASAAKERDREGRFDLLRMLEGLVVDDPDRHVHIAKDILVNRTGKLVLEGSWPDFRMGAWYEPSIEWFESAVRDGIKKHGRRDLSGFIAAHERSKQEEQSSAEEEK